MLTPVRQRALDETRRIVLNRLSGRRARAYFFGCCTETEVKEWRSIDVAIEMLQPLPNDLRSEIESDLEDSTVPFFVNVTDLWKAPPDILKKVRREGVELLP